MRISDWSSDVCSPDLSRSGGTRLGAERGQHACAIERGNRPGPSGGLPLALVPFGAASTHQRELEPLFVVAQGLYRNRLDGTVEKPKQLVRQPARFVPIADFVSYPRSEEHTSELQSLMRISYAVFCLKKKKKNKLQ